MPIKTQSSLTSSFVCFRFIARSNIRTLDVILETYAWQYHNNDLYSSVSVGFK